MPEDFQKKSKKREEVTSLPHSVRKVCNPLKNEGRGVEAGLPTLFFENFSIQI